MPIHLGAPEVSFADEKPRFEAARSAARKLQKARYVLIGYVDNGYVDEALIGTDSAQGSTTQ